MKTKPISVEDVEYYVKTYVILHGPIETKENLIDLLNWVEYYKAIPKTRRSKILRMKRAIHGRNT